MISRGRHPAPTTRVGARGVGAGSLARPAVCAEARSLLPPLWLCVEGRIFGGPPFVTAHRLPEGRGMHAVARGFYTAVAFAHALNSPTPLRSARFRVFILVILRKGRHPPTKNRSGGNFAPLLGPSWPRPPACTSGFFTPGPLRVRPDFFTAATCADTSSSIVRAWRLWPRATRAAWLLRVHPWPAWRFGLCAALGTSARIPRSPCARPCFLLVSTWQTRKQPWS